MELIKTVYREQYEFEIVIKSKTEHAHSLISDNKDDLSIQLNYLSDFINQLVEQHKLTKK